MSEKRCCPKCRSTNIHVQYRCMMSSERLEYRCRECRYGWSTPCSGAEPEAKPAPSDAPPSIEWPPPDLDASSLHYTAPGVAEAGVRARKHAAEDMVAPSEGKTMRVHCPETCEEIRETERQLGEAARARDEGEKWGKALHRVMDEHDMLGLPGPTPTYGSPFWEKTQKAALRFHAECVAPLAEKTRKLVGKAASVAIALRMGRGRDDPFEELEKLEDLVVCLRHDPAFFPRPGNILPDQGEPPEDPGHDAIRGDPARVDDGMVETGMEEAPRANDHGEPAGADVMAARVLNKPRVSDEELGRDALAVLNSLLPHATLTSDGERLLGAAIREKLEEE